MFRRTEIREAAPIRDDLSTFAWLTPIFNPPCLGMRLLRVTRPLRGPLPKFKWPLKRRALYYKNISSISDHRCKNKCEDLLEVCRRYMNQSSVVFILFYGGLNQVQVKRSRKTIVSYMMYRMHKTEKNTWMEANWTNENKTKFLFSHCLLIYH